METPSITPRSKLIHVTLHFFRGLIGAGGVQRLHVRSEEQYADRCLEKSALKRKNLLVHREVLTDLSWRILYILRRAFGFLSQKREQS